MNSKRKSVLYIRSANNSKESLDSQRLDGKNYAKQFSMPLEIIEDFQSSGLTLMNERPGLQKLIHLIKTGEIKTVIVTSYSRISRDVVELHYFQSLIEKQNAKLVVLNDIH